MTVHLYCKETFTGEGRTLRVSTVSLCGDILKRESEISTRLDEVTCPLCQWLHERETNNSTSGDTTSR